ncbi:nose resistant to fluoxetine protein 6 [Caerostris extrusa]|uniref:Nose resistant to fluoxetine protein 6 n=1 Tax=Caerostris extrusa TaxID=172846 RepID=A0AAV4Q7J2_CAEEX|nr:nose resistant to fluoxetine protein 6 [Caerostris extrusa]
MVAHKKIILKWGALFILVALKIDSVASRTLIDSEQDRTTNSSGALRDFPYSSEIVPSSSSFHHANTTMTHRQSDIPVSVQNEDRNSSFTSPNTDDPLEITEISNGSSVNTMKSVPKDELTMSYDNQHAVQDEMSNHFKTDSLQNSSHVLSNEEAVLDEVLNDSIESIPAVVDIEESNTTMVKVVIEHFGKNIKKLKENVHSFKDNLRKILFETDTHMSSKSPENHTMPSTSIHVEESSENKHNEHGNVTFQHQSIIEECQERGGSLELNKISAVASNISEVSRRVGAFLQDHYWDSNKDQKQSEMISRGLENLVGGVEEVVPSSQVLQQWVNLEESFRESVDAVVRQALPLLVRASSEMQLSNGCYTSFFQLLLGLRRLRPWAFQMIDAFGKPPAGMLQGTVTSFGAYDECVNIVAASDAKKYSQQYFRGKYCTVEIKPPLPPKPQYYTMYQPVSILANFSNGDDNVIRQAARQAHAFYFLTYRMDICVPSTCTQEDVNNMAQFAAKYIDIEVTVPRCSVKENLHFDKTQVITICILGVLVLLVVFGTILDILKEMFNRTKFIIRCLSSALFKFLRSFSLNTNANLLLNTDSAQNGLDSVHGMRFFGMGWLILGHTYFNSNIQMYGNLSEASAFAEGFFFQIIVNSTVSIDTFFFISAKTYKDPPHLHDGDQRHLHPAASRFGPLLERDRRPRGGLLQAELVDQPPLHQQLHHHSRQRCLEHSWYISCDFQLFVIALFILLALIKRPVFGMVLNIMMIVVSMVTTGLLTYYYKVPPTLLASFPDPEERKFLNHVIISKPFCHLGPYCVGLATGYFFYKCKEIKLKPYHHIIGWGSAISVTAAVVYGVLEWNKGHLPSTAAALAYAATHRTAWALGLSWITIICVAGYGGLINSILSWKVFIPLSRLTCMVYLIHPLIQYILTGYIRERLQTNHIILAYFFFGHIMTSYALSAACFFLFDGPVEALMRLILGDYTAPIPELAKTSAIKKVLNNNIYNEKKSNLKV